MSGHHKFLEPSGQRNFQKDLSSLPIVLFCITTNSVTKKTINVFFIFTKKKKESYWPVMAHFHQWNQAFRLQEVGVHLGFHKLSISQQHLKRQHDNMRKISYLPFHSTKVVRSRRGKNVMNIFRCNWSTQPRWLIDCHHLK